MEMLFHGSIRVARLLGIDVYVHWAWVLVMGFLIHQVWDRFDNPAWAVANCLMLFGIVLMHEFGHALACRSVGGIANRIILWPLGGVAFVQPPARPGAVLWSIAAGPLVNVALMPVFLGLTLLAYFPAYDFNWGASSDLQRFILSAVLINTALLCFNMLPVFPLDGGQILMSLLWFVIGQSRALAVTAGIGLAAALTAGVFCFLSGKTWLLVMAVFVALQAWNGLKAVRHVRRFEEYQRQQDERRRRDLYAPPTWEP